MPKRPSVPCAECGKLLWKSKDRPAPPQQTCRDCLRRKSPPAEYKPKAMRSCAHCGETFGDYTGRMRFCSTTCSGLATRKITSSPVPWATCQHCGSTFIASGRRRMFCGTKCSRASFNASDKGRAVRAKYKARRRGALTGGELIRPDEIYSRDGYRCQLCCKPLAMKQQAPHPKSPTLDHVLPLAEGGTHTRANVQAAHFLCNSLKGAGGVDQLRLIG